MLLVLVVAEIWLTRLTSSNHTVKACVSPLSSAAHQLRTRRGSGGRLYYYRVPGKGRTSVCVYASHYYTTLLLLSFYCYITLEQNIKTKKKHIKRLYTGQDCNTFVCSGTAFNATDVRKCIWCQRQNWFVFNYIGTALINGTIFDFFNMLCIVPVLGASHRVGVHYYSQETWTNKQKQQ